MNFIRSSRADESRPVNLDHVFSIDKCRGVIHPTIEFETSSGQTIMWRYFDNTKNRDLDYEEIMLRIFKEDN